MAKRLLQNQEWDFASRCWVCEPGNDRGLEVPFFLDEDARRVVAEFTPEPCHSGAPEFAHTGFSTALLEEGMAWAVIAVAHKWGVTRRSQSVFSRPVRIGQPHTLHAWIEGGYGSDLTAAAEILDGRGKVCVAVRADFYVMTGEEAERALGVRSDAVKEYTRA
ncbi:MAG: PaaI family thioesterase [Dehalococcoidia bacterium]|nr:PaaI family thioesterase [Dehalococcoidia bacterium]